MHFLQSLYIGRRYMSVEGPGFDFAQSLAMQCAKGKYGREKRRAYA